MIAVSRGLRDFDAALGSETAVKIAQRSRVPVLAAPRDASELPRRAVAAIDFTESSILAARLAASLLGPGGLLSLVHVSILVKQDPESGTLPDVYTRGASEKLEGICARIHTATDQPIRTVVIHGEILDGLLSYIERERCDLLALGGHDPGFLDRLLLGSVRPRVLRNAHCQVLVVRQASSEP